MKSWNILHLINMSNYSLFLDDIRHPLEVRWVDLPPVQWIIVKSYKEFVSTVEKDGIPIRVTFDHDLADEHYPQGVGIHVNDPRIKDIKLPYDSYNEKTGYHCCKWLIEYCLDKNLPFPEYYIHTMNPVGLLNIQSLVDSYYKSIDKDIIPSPSTNLISSASKKFSLL